MSAIETWKIASALLENPENPLVTRLAAIVPGGVIVPAPCPACNHSHLDPLHSVTEVLTNSFYTQNYYICPLTGKKVILSFTA